MVALYALWSHAHYSLLAFRQLPVHAADQQQDVSTVPESPLYYLHIT